MREWTARDCPNHGSTRCNQVVGTAVGTACSHRARAQVMAQLNHVARKEGLALPPPLAARIVAVSGRNLRRALLALEVARAQCCPLNEAQPVGPPDWELYIGVSCGVWLCGGCVCVRVCVAGEGRGGCVQQERLRDARLAWRECRCDAAFA